MLRKVKDVSLNPSIKTGISSTIDKEHITLKLKSFNYLNGNPVQILSVNKIDILNITRVAHNIFNITLELYYIIRSINDQTKRIQCLNPYHNLNWDDALFLKINLQGIVDELFTKQEKEDIGITSFIIDSIIQASGHIIIELGSKEINTTNPWDYAYDTPVIPLVYSEIYYTSQYISGIEMFNSDRSIQIYQADKEIAYLNSLAISLNALVILKDECLTEKKTS